MTVPTLPAGMPNERGTTPSVWRQQTEMPRFAPLPADRDADVVVVGAGITGLTTAYLLAKSGRRVVVVDQFQPGHGMTGQTTAHLTVVQDRVFSELEKKHDRETALHIGQSHMAAIDLVERIVADGGIDCEFRRVDGFLVDTYGVLDGDRYGNELQLLQQIGFPDVEALEEGSAPLIGTGRAIRVPRQARVHALDYLKGLARVVQAQGTAIHGDTHVTDIEDGRVTTADGKTIHADVTVLATHVPPNALEVATKLTPLTTYVIAATLPRDKVRDALYWDTEEPYHYVRFERWDDTHDVVIVGGEDHRTGETDADADLRFDALESWARTRIPQMGAVVARWTGQVFDPADGRAYIGRSNEYGGQTYVATGFSGNGMTHGTLAAIILNDLVNGDHNAWAETYEPTRKKGLMMKEGLKHNVKVVQHLVGDRLHEETVETLAKLAPGEGMVVKHDGEHVAAYRHPDGRLEQHSAMCTHMGCLVQWNGLEKTFDCPCHGSHFGVDGSVLTGPAVSPLKPLGAKTETDKEQRKR